MTVRLDSIGRKITPRERFLGQGRFMKVTLSFDMPNFPRGFQFLRHAIESVLSLVDINKCKWDYE